MTRPHRALGALLTAILAALAACSLPASGTGRQPAYPDPAQYRFARFTTTCSGVPGYLPEAYGGHETPLQREGACTCYLWPGGDPTPRAGSPENARGNPRFWRMAETHTWEIAREVDLPVNFNFLKILDSRRHGERFRDYGLLNDPGCKPAAQPDAYGLWLDDCEDPYSSGIMGIRLYPNPDFDPRAWNAATYLERDPRIEPPYLAGLSCGVCHIALNPVDPPEDPARPRWENLVPALGNQYFKEGEFFRGGLSEDDFLYWVYRTQEPGTSDTSRISQDFINNPNVINAIFYIVSHRPTAPEVMDDGSVKPVPHILKDGADSVGAAEATLRVYVNIGSCPDTRMGLEDTFAGLRRRQAPLDFARAVTECEDLRLTGARIPGLGAFLDSLRPYYLKDAPGGARYLTADAATLALGKRVFAERCARCHSSKLPEEVTGQGLDKHADAARPAWVRLVLRDDFLQDNFLSDDQRYPIVATDPRMAIGTNAARALATNATTGHIWQNLSSRTYKSLPSPGLLTLYNPFDPPVPIRFQVPGGGRGYYRTPSLINIWATAPFFHNNALGLFNQDPSVDGRMEAFMDAAERLLWPEKRLGPASIKVTPRDTRLRVRLGPKSLDIRVPAGTPINLLANIDLQRVMERSELLDQLKQLLADPARLVRLIGVLNNRGPFDDELRRFVPDLLRYNLSPDFVEDGGHTQFGPLSDGEKRALIEFMKTF